MTTDTFAGRYALITGASRGIGRAIALTLAKHGAHIIALARTQGALEELDDDIQALGGTATLLQLDLKKTDEIAKIGPSLAERFGGLDIFIGNAGILGPLTPVHQVKPKDWDRVMAINFTANVHLVRTLDPLLRASTAGRVVLTTSGIAEMLPAYWGPYAASKAALNAFMKTYAAETLQTNMKVNALNPGPVETDMLAEAYPGGYPGPVNTVETVADTCLELCSDACSTHGTIKNQ